MPRSNLDTVRANSEAFSRRDVDAMLELHAPDAVVVDRRPVGFGEFRGHDAIRSYYAGLFDNTSGLHEHLEVVEERGDVVVASCHLRARLAGADADEVTFDYALRIGIAGGLIATVEIFESAAAAG
jgi:ketosteroid isomerase-like protein